MTQTMAGLVTAATDQVAQYAGAELVLGHRDGLVDDGTPRVLGQSVNAGRVEL